MLDGVVPMEEGESRQKGRGARPHARQLQAARGRRETHRPTTVVTLPPPSSLHGLRPPCPRSRVFRLKDNSLPLRSSRRGQCQVCLLQRARRQTVGFLSLARTTTAFFSRCLSLLMSVYQLAMVVQHELPTAPVNFDLFFHSKLCLVTQLKCGGFVIGLHMCHCIADGFGILRFIKTIADFACGELIPTTLPVWKRDIFTACMPPSLAHVYPAYQPFIHGLNCTMDDVMLSTPPESMEVQYLFFGPKEVEILRSHVPKHLSKSTTTFELLTAVMWRCRTLALGYELSEKVRLMFTLNARGRSINGEGAVPRGYYGNAHFSPMLEVSVDELAKMPLTHILEKMRQVKLDTTKERMKSMVDLLALWRKRSPFGMDRTYEVSDTKWVGGNALKFGKAELVAVGTPHAGDFTSKLISYHTKCMNKDGEESTVVSILLPKPAMEKFTKEMAIWLKR